MTATRKIPSGKVSSREQVLLGLVLIAGTLLVYVPGMRAGFIWNDDTFLTQNPPIQASDGLYRFWFTTEPPDYFPLTSTSLWIEWRFWGMNAAGYHVTNVFLHALAAVFIWRILLRLQIPGAWLAAAVFAVHPVNVESVVWITERKNTLSMPLYLSAVLFYLRCEDHQRRSAYWLSLTLFVLALLAKTSVIMLPLVLLGCAWWRRRTIQRRDLLRVLPFLGCALLLGLITVWFQYARSIGADVIRTDSLWSRLAIAGMAVWFYLYKALLPFNLSFVYPRWQIDPSSQVLYLPVAAVVLALVAFWRFRHTWGRACLAGFGYFVVNLLPVLGFFNIYFMRYSFVSDHWQYVSIIGIITLVVGAIASFIQRRPRLRRPAVTGAAIVVTGLAILSWRQALVYHAPETLWRDTLAKNRKASLAYNGLGGLLLARGNIDEAFRYYSESLRVRPDLPEDYVGLANALTEMRRYDEAIVRLEEALRINSRYFEAHTNLGILLSGLGRHEDAIPHLSEALRLRPRLAVAHFNLGVACHRKGDLPEAVRLLTRGLELKDDPKAHVQLARVLVEQGDLDSSISHCRRATVMDPDLVEAAQLLGDIYMKQGRIPDAVAQFRTMLAQRPDWPPVLNNLAWILATSGDAAIRSGQEAVALAEHAAKVTACKDPQTLDTLAAAYAEVGRFDEAVAVVQQALAVAGQKAPPAWVQQLHQRQELYRSHRPYREPTPPTRPGKDR